MGYSLDNLKNKRKDSKTEKREAKKDENSNLKTNKADKERANKIYRDDRPDYTKYKPVIKSDKINKKEAEHKETKRDAKSKMCGNQTKLKTEQKPTAVNPKTTSN